MQSQTRTAYSTTFCCTEMMHLAPAGVSRGCLPNPWLGYSANLKRIPAMILFQLYDREVLLSER